MSQRIQDFYALKTGALWGALGKRRHQILVAQAMKELAGEV